MGNFLALIIMFVIGNRLQNEILDEVKPNRLNSTWYGIPYIGRSYVRKCHPLKLKK